MPEEWKPVLAFPGYEVSSRGQVRSVLTRMDMSTGRELPRTRPIVLRQKSKASGYLEVCLRRAGEKHMRYVHRLVLEAFRGAPPAKSVGCHLNGITTDNRLENLVWANRRINAGHRQAHGTARVVRLSPVKRVAILHLHRAGMSTKEIGVLLKLNEKTVRLQLPPSD